ncbi:MAG: DUF3024 domain-containing protein [Chitinophagaceae bacterium]
MAFKETQLKEITALMDAYIADHRPPEEIRKQLDIGWRYDKQSIYLFEIRPQWNDKSIINNYDFAKATWVESKKQWNVYWMRSNLKWYSYDPLPWVVNLQRFLLEIESDPYGCFRG